MDKLFIIGNGFDLYHGIKTKYSDFRDWYHREYCAYLKNNDGDFLTCEDLVSPSIFRQGWSDKHVSLRIIKLLIDNACSDNNNKNEWNNLEANLGKLDFEEWIIKCTNCIENIEKKTLRNKNNIINEITNSLMYIEELKEIYFKQWVDSIEINKNSKGKKFEKIFDKDSYFLTFNYTNTLELLYDSLLDKGKINHIHIRKTQKNGKEITEYVLGTKFSDENERLKEIDSVFSDWYIKHFTKPTDEIIKNNSDFFNHIYNCKKIYTFGFSFSEVDLPYIENILDSINSSEIVFYFNRRDMNKKDFYLKQISKVNNSNKEIIIESYPLGM